MLLRRLGRMCWRRCRQGRQSSTARSSWRRAFYWANAPTGEGRLWGSGISGRPKAVLLPTATWFFLTGTGEPCFRTFFLVPVLGSGAGWSLMLGCTLHQCQGTQQVVPRWLGCQTEGGLHKESPELNIPLFLRAGPKVLIDTALVFDVCLPPALETTAVRVTNSHRPVTVCAGLESQRSGHVLQGVKSLLGPLLLTTKLLTGT